MQELGWKESSISTMNDVSYCFWLHLLTPRTTREDVLVTDAVHMAMTGECIWCR